ncbi:30S ribosomal protein S20 [soil metagenome]
MANSRSAAKRARQTIVRTQRNKATKTRIKSARKAILSALEAGDSALAQEKYRAFSSAADKAAKTKVIHKNAASRLKSNLARVVNAPPASS